MVQLVLAQAMGSTPLSWLLLMVVGAALVGGVAIATVLMGNRHTRGVTKTAIIGGLLFVGLLTILGVNRMRTAEAAAYHREISSREAEAMADHLTAMAQEMELEYGDTTVLAEEYHRKAAELRDQAVVHQSSSVRKGLAVGMISPILLIPFALIVFMLFKHCGPAVGVAALAVPFMFLGFGFISYQRQASYESPWVAAPKYQDASDYSQAFLAELEPVGEVPVVVENVPHPPDGPDEPVAVEVVQSEGPSAEVSDESQQDSAALQPDGVVESTGTELPAAVASDTPPISNGTEVVEVAASPAIDPVDSDPAVESPPPVNMPEWVRQPPKSVPNVYRKVIESGFRGDRSECEKKISQHAEQAVFEYLSELAVEENRGPTYVPRLSHLGITSRYIRENIYSESEAPYYELRDFPHQDGMVNMHVLLEFDRNDTDELLNRWRAYERRERIQVVGVLMGGVLASLAGVLGLIKLDTYTKGYYTKRLFIGVPAAIIGGGMLIALLS